MSDVYRFTFDDPANQHAEKADLCIHHGCARGIAFLQLDTVSDKPELQRAVRFETPLVADGCSVDEYAFCAECNP